LDNAGLYFITLLWIVIAVIVHITMFFVTAPFGRHTSEKWGITINNKLAWFVMELPSLAIMTYYLFAFKDNFKSFVWILFVLWIIHYVNRTIIYPIRIKSTPKKMPLAIALSAIFFNLINAELNGYYLSKQTVPEEYDLNWICSTHFLVGILLFSIGMYINIRSDNILISLRKPGETGYKIPKGFLFKYISSPNLFGEIVEWSGFTMMAWNLPALSFMVWTCANLIPRAKNHYDWNMKNIPNYPKERKIVFPFFY
jgi:steroid 5-alpha reductase family enzyme